MADMRKKNGPNDKSSIHGSYVRQRSWIEKTGGWRDVSTKTGWKEGDEGRKEKRDSLEIQARVWKWKKSRHHGLGTANKGKNQDREWD